MLEEEQWKDIPGLPSYQASVEGNIRKLKKNGKYRYVRTISKEGVRRKKFHVIGQDGKKHTEMISIAVARAFIGEVPEGKIVGHRNGITTDNCIGNLFFTDYSDMYSKINERKRKPVAKLDLNGEIIKVYKSSKEAAKDAYMSRQAIVKRCCGNVKRSPAVDGYEYAYDGDLASIRHALKRLNIRTDNFEAFMYN